MNRNLQNDTKLTEFPPITPEEENSSISGLFSRFFKSKGIIIINFNHIVLHAIHY